MNATHEPPLRVRYPTMAFHKSAFHMYECAALLRIAKRMTMVAEEIDLLVVCSQMEDEKATDLLSVNS